MHNLEFEDKHNEIWPWYTQNPIDNSGQGFVSFFLKEGDVGS